ncbi:MAG: hypothetical protein IJM71_05590 [Clostridia bacterium]|nr:hypothetical protein [Clostridia bacterium]
MASKRHKEKHLNVWVKSGIILAVGLIVSAALLSTALALNNRGELKPDDQSDTESSGSNLPVVIPDEVKVSFYDEAENVVEEKTVAYGAAVFPPTLENAGSGKVFLGWSQNLSCMTKDTQIYPEYDDYSDRQNVISFDTVYIDSSDELEIQLKLGGIVELASFKMKVCYDDSVLHLKDLTGLAEGLNAETNQGEVEFLLDSEENIINSIPLATFHFDIEDVDFIKTDLVIQLEDGEKTEGGGKKYVDCTMVNGTVYIY